MKLLENINFEAINAALCTVRGGKRIVGRIESYSCKLVGNDKKTYKQTFSNERNEPEHILAFSPPQSLSVSPVSHFGPFCYESCNRKTLFYLIATLNSAFPDYDFSNLKSHNFSKEPSFEMVANYINNSLSAELQEQWIQLATRFWTTVDSDINLRDCAIYSYVPETDADNPYAEDGNLWSMNYFFFNQKLKRIVFFTCRALSSTAPLPEEEIIGWDEEDDVFEDDVDRSNYDYDEDYDRTMSY